MLGTDNIQSWDYEKTRCFLLSQTAGFRRLSDKMKVKHKLKGLSKKVVKSELMRSSFGFHPELHKDLDTISNELNLVPLALENMMSGWDKVTGLDFIPLPAYPASGDAFPDGFYIRVDPHTREETVLKTYRYIKGLWKDLEKYLDEKGKKPKIVKRNKKPDNLKEKTRLFIVIEETVFKKSRLKDKKDSILDNEYVRSTVDDAIKFASEETYKKERFKYAKDVYYKLLEYYQIPSSSEFEQLLIKLSL